MDVKPLSDQLSVSPQVHLDEIGEIAGRFRLLINNRPDGEEPGQPSSAELAHAANCAGLDYRHIPVVPGQLREDEAAEFGDAVANSDGAALAFCRTGMRSASLWALSQAGKLPPERITDAAERAGYDLSALEPRLQQPPAL